MGQGRFQRCENRYFKISLEDFKFVSVSFSFTCIHEKYTHPAFLYHSPLCTNLLFARRLTALYEFHNDINGAEGLRWYYGGGPHLGFYNSKHYNGSTLLGVDGVLGLDYKLSGTPLNFSLDWQPSFEFGDGSGFDGWGGLAVRIAF